MEAVSRVREWSSIFSESPLSVVCLHFKLSLISDNKYEDIIADILNIRGPQTRFFSVRPHLLFNEGDGLARIETFRTRLRAIHDSVATVQLERVVQGCR